MALNNVNVCNERITRGGDEENTGKNESADTRLQQYLKMPFSITYSTGELMAFHHSYVYPNC